MPGKRPLSHSERTSGPWLFNQYEWKSSSDRSARLRTQYTSLTISAIGHPPRVSHTPKNRAATDDSPLSAPHTASPVRDREMEWRNADTPDSATSINFTNSVTWYSVERSPMSMSSRFQIPVINSSANAGQ